MEKRFATVPWAERRPQISEPLRPWFARSVTRRVTDRANQGRNGSEICGRLSAHGTVANRFSIGDKGQSGGRFLLVEEFLVENDLSRYAVAAKLAQFFKAVDDDDIGGKPFGSCRCASPQSCEHYFLRGARRLARIFDQLGSLRSTNPMRNFDFFQLDFESELAHLGSDKIHSCFGLGRSAGTRT